MKIVEYYKLFWINYVNFSGRSRRAAFWTAWAINFMICVILDAMFVLLELPVISTLTTLFSLLTLIPSISLWVRRLHDIGKSGKWILLVFVPLIGPVCLVYWACIEGSYISNEYGPDPKAGLH